MPRRSIFSDFLAELGVPHTAWYSDRQFAAMTFRSLFGLSKLMESYGVPCEALKVADKAQALHTLDTPFLARVGSGFVIVTAIAVDGTVSFRDGIAPGVRTLPEKEFCKDWSGVVLLAYPDRQSGEPAFSSHRITETGNRLKPYVLAIALVFVAVYLFVSRGLYHSFAAVALIAVTIAGLYISYELVLKSLNIHSERADRICGIIDRTGCNTVLKTSAAKFFGIFGWSEVGLAYFGVTLTVLLAFPQHLPQLALINACCCPFSLWSVWYQKTQAKAWCTMCLIVQACLWLSLACYAFGGFFAGAFPLNPSLLVLGACYVAALLIINAITSKYDKDY